MVPELLTKNRQGSMFPLSKYTQAFIAYVKQQKGIMLDIGAAYGVTTIPALEAGAKVIANDISADQLDILEDNTPVYLRENLTKLVGYFPDYDLPLGLLDGVLASHSLHFLTPDKFRIGVEKIYGWLKPAAKVFVLCFTPYHKFMAKFIDEYEANIAMGKEWPGYVEDSNAYALVENLLPNQVNLIDPTILAREFIAAGFQIECVEFTPCAAGINPEFFALDGREWVGLVAHKVATTTRVGV